MSRVRNQTPFSTPQFLARIKHLARMACPGTSSGHRCQALAAGLGYASYAALMVALECKPSGLASVFDIQAYCVRLAGLGLAARPALNARDLDDFKLDVVEALHAWLFAHDGYIDMDGMGVSFEISDRSMARKHAVVLADLATRGLGSSPRPSSWGGYPSSLTWSCNPLPPRSSGDVMTALRLMVPRDKGEDMAGWGHEYPDHGVHLPARAVLSMLSGGWLTGCLVPWGGQAMVHDLAEAIGQAGFHQAAASLPAMRIEVDGQGMHVEGDGYRFSALSESILCVESLALLGDSMAHDIKEKGMQANAQDMLAAQAWVSERSNDGLRSLWRGLDEDVDNVDKEVALAEWTALRIGMEPELYTRAAQWTRACHMLRSGGGQFDSGLQDTQGLQAAALGVLPDKTGVTRLVEAAMSATAPVDTADPVLWQAYALNDLNLAAWPMCYYRCWSQRRAMRLDELEPGLNHEPLLAWAAEVNAALADGASLLRQWSRHGQPNPVPHPVQGIG